MLEYSNGITIKATVKMPKWLKHENKNRNCLDVERNFKTCDALSGSQSSPGSVSSRRPCKKTAVTSHLIYCSKQLVKTKVIR